MKYLKARLREPTTWLGLLTAAAPLLTQPGSTASIVAGAVASLGLVVVNEKKGQQ